MSERFEGEREELAEYGFFLNMLVRELDSFRWKPDPYLIDLYLKRELLEIYGNAITKYETKGCSVERFTKNVDNKFFFYLNENDKIPVMVGEKFNQRDTDLKIHLTNYGAEMAKKIVLELKEKNIEKEIRKKPKEKISLENWILMLHESVNTLINFNYVLKQSTSFFGRRPTSKEKADMSDCIRKLIGKNKLGFENGNTYYKKAF